MDIPRYDPQQLSQLPKEPGVYKFFNTENDLIYVGKAKNLKSRVSSYFQKSKGTTRKTKKLVSEIGSFEVVIVDSEFDALLLENNLIKENQPRYNILLKDDKSFPFIVVTKERFPRIHSSRRRIPEYGKYYGPYANVKAMNNVLHLIRSLYKIRTCRLQLLDKSIKAKKFKVCLEYHIKNCLGPCEDLQDEESYMVEIKLAEEILKGNTAIVKRAFKEGMTQAAADLKFEEAQVFKEKLELLEKFQSRSLIVNPKLSNIDVFSITSDEKSAYINYLKIINGMINLSKTVEVKKQLDETDEEILPLMMINLREEYQSDSREILVNRDLDISWDGFKIIKPQIGDKFKLIELSVKNALFFKKERLNYALPKDQTQNRVLEKLQADLRLKSLPVQIECFDNSNLQGTNPTASMVCFINGKPAKKEYRHYNIKTVVGPDDFASMKEVTHRRYKRLLDEGKKLPELIVIDGGKGQLSSACQALQELGIYGDIAIVGIAKRLEEIYFPLDSFPLFLEKKSESLMLLQRLRNEAHRFAINHHRNKRSKATFTSSLDNIPGVGETTIEKLRRNFSSTSKIKAASMKDLSDVIGASKAKIIYTFFKG